MTTFKRLLAKSSKTPDTPDERERLSGHTASVLNAAEELAKLRLDASLDAVGLTCSQWRDRGLRMLRLSAFMHDLGKANDQFQRMLRSGAKVSQAMRHEAISLWLCWPGQPLSDWLRPAVETDDDYLCAVIAAAGHHRKFWTEALKPMESGAGPSVTVLATHADFGHTLKVARSRELGVGEVPMFQRDIVVDLLAVPKPKQVFQRWEAASVRFCTGDLARILGVIKALTLAADVAGSILRKAEAAWIGEWLEMRSNEEVLGNVIATRLGGKKPRPFQDAIAQSDAPVTLVRAGCGSGKTLGAYLWAKAQHASRRLWFTYPTTGTATEGYRDYLFGVATESMLDHGRVGVDRDFFKLAHTREDDSQRERLDALEAWRQSAITCTVDSVLGLVQNHRKGLYAWPSLAHSAIVFDEIHAYDDSLFSALLHFLSAFPGTPALLMTASLPAGRLERLREVVRSAHRRELFEVPGPTELEELKRYYFVQSEDRWDLITRTLAGGKKVLWVCNTVAACMKAASDAEHRGLNSKVYHSRFRYIDRLCRHQDLIAAFKEGAGGVLGITTQVAEMSLDVSADLLVTDLAPIPSLIQRLGRLNRRSTPDDPRPTMPCLVLPFDGKPYEERELSEAKIWLQSLKQQAELSQRDLMNAWPAQSATSEELVPSTFREGGFSTIRGDLRVAAPGITVILAEDAVRVRSREVSAIEVALPMGFDRSAKVDDWKRCEFYPIPPEGTIAYDSLRGGQWVK